MTNQELQALITDLESDRVERTESTRDTDKFCQAICAFSNDFPNHRQPGYLVIGADNAGKIRGIPVTDELLKNLGGLRSDGNIQPLPAMIVSKYSLPAGDVVVIEVMPSDLPPVRYRGRVWIRVGPRRAIANETEERILSERRAALARTFDAQPCPECTLDEFVLDLFLVTYRGNAVSDDVIRANNRSAREQLASLRFYDLTRDCATNAGALLFGRDPLRWLPGAYVQFVRFDGDTMADPVISEHRFTGDLLTVLRGIDASVPVQTTEYPVPVTALTETMVRDYPGAAIKELLMNAVMHRDYHSNAPVHFRWFRSRIEIQNPGGLYGAATPENFPRQTSYRNPVIAEAMKALGYVNRYGVGIAIAQAALARNGNPPAEFETSQPMFFLATIMRTS